MTRTLKSPKGLLILTTAFLLSACAGNDKEAVIETEAPTGNTEAASGDGRPGAVMMSSVESDNLNADPFGAANQDSLTAFSGDRVYFDYDSSELTSEARADLKKQAEWLSHHSRVDLVIEGHCDERGTREYNLALGERRANAVKNYLVALGVSSSRVETISYGKERPAVIGAGERSWRLNRRGVIQVK